MVAVGQALPLIKLLRPHQWLKNLMIYFPPFLGGALLNQGVPLKGVIPFFIFSAASSCGYIFNDLIDREADRQHPRKAKRGIPSGSVSVKAAGITAVILAVLSISSALYINRTFAIYLASYLMVTVAYSCQLKNIPVIDLFCIASGFLIRLMAGGTIFGIVISEWLFLSVFLLSLFLGAGKRLSEKLALDDTAVEHRKVLGIYPAGFLDGVLFMTGGSVLVTYTMYSLSHRTLLYSVPLCCFGLLRYILRVKTGLSGDPTESLLRDPWLLVVGAAWSVMVGWGVYGGG